MSAHGVPPTYPLASGELSRLVRDSLLRGPVTGFEVRELERGRFWARPGVALGPTSDVALCVGSFDGFHRGHRLLVTKTVNDARRRGALAAALTFEPLPAQFFGAAGGSHRLLSNEERVVALLGAGLDAVIVLDFDDELASTTYEDFVTRTLPRLMRVGALHVGTNFRLGRGGAGTLDRLRELGERHGIAVTGHELLAADGVAVSSTRIRRLVHEGDVERASRLLGRLPLVSGSVGHGRGEGARLGFPTANVVVDPTRCLPRKGVYAGVVVHGRRAWPAAVNVGKPPTFSSPDPAFLEAHLVGFSGDLYGDAVSVLFCRWLRASRCFSSLDELERTVLGNVTWVRDNIGSAGVEVPT